MKTKAGLCPQDAELNNKTFIKIQLQNYFEEI